MHDHLLTEVLGERIWILRSDRRRFRRWVDIRNPVTRRRSRVEKPLYARLAGSFEHRNSAVDVGAMVIERPFYRWHDVRQRRHVKDPRCAFKQWCDEVMVRDVDIVDRELFCVRKMGQILGPAIDEIVDDDDLLPLLQKPFYDVAADEPRTSCDDATYGFSPCCRIYGLRGFCRG